ncbi:ubiquitin carboxyl-terminal hydrolase 36 [Drosophila innubila]|uniref:ubiquitin carboxyl-terminal hydrolase 36 n=1 Tax=Drosophila innubila TaxID=198719 RepID=UPI00148CAD58|nr:ubiquitin carboxyl-terminal hydrolase 36 [Drosophila innubila]
MSNGKATASFFENGSTTQFEYCYKLYPEVLKMKAEKRSKKPQELIRLDQWFQNELPGLIKARGKDAHLVYDELVQAMKWKQSRGKFYPQLSYLVKVNTPRAVIQETKKAFRKLPNLEQAITALSNLKGVGTTMASALLTAAAPDSAPFMADECLMAIPEIEGIDYTTKEYLNFVQHIQSTVERLNAEVGGETPHWSPHRVELALWSHYVANDLSPELLDDMPPPGVVANNANTTNTTNGSLSLSLSSKSKVIDNDDTNDGVAVDVDDESLGAGGRNTATESETENENTNPIALLPLNSDSALAKINSNSNNSSNNNNNTAALQDGDSNFVSNDSTSQEEPIIDDNTTQTTATTTSTEDGEPIGGGSDSESNLEAPTHNNNKLNNNGQKTAGGAAGGATAATATGTTATVVAAAAAANGNGNTAGNGVLTLETAASASLPAHPDDEDDDEDEDDEDEDEEEDDDDDEDVDDELEADESNSSSNIRSNNKLQQLQTVVAATAPSIGQKRTALHCEMEAAAIPAAAADKSSPELKKLRSD